MNSSGSPDDTKLPKKGCLGLYAAWAGLLALFFGFLILTGTAARDALFFGIILLVVPGAIVAGHFYGEHLLKGASARLGFRIRRLSWKDGVRFGPSFEAEDQDGDWHADLLEGSYEGMEVALYDRSASARGAGRKTPRSSLGAIWTLPGVKAPRLVAHGSTRYRVLVTVRDTSGRFVDTLSTLPSVVPPSPVEGFGKRFRAFGEPGAEVLLTEGAQKALLGLPRRCRLLVEGSTLRWDLEREPPLSRGLGRRAEEMLRITVPLRDALIEAAALLPPAS